MKPAVTTANNCNIRWSTLARLSRLTAIAFNERALAITTRMRKRSSTRQHSIARSQVQATFSTGLYAFEAENHASINEGRQTCDRRLGLLKDPTPGLQRSRQRFGRIMSDSFCVGKSLGSKPNGFSISSAMISSDTNT